MAESSLSNNQVILDYYACLAIESRERLNKLSGTGGYRVHDHLKVYIFKTEQEYGGEVRVFANREQAEQHLAQFVEKTQQQFDALIVEQTILLPLE